MLNVVIFRCFNFFNFELCIMIIFISKVIRNVKEYKCNEMTAILIKMSYHKWAIVRKLSETLDDAYK